MPLLSDYTETVLTLAGIYAIAAIGLQITLASGQFSIMHGALMGIGSYAAGISAVELGAPLPATIGIAMAITFLLGLAVSALTLRLDGFLVGIATLAIGQAAAIIFLNVDYFGGSLGYSGVPIRTTLPMVLITLGIIMYVITRFRRSRIGLALLASGQDEIAARSLGVSVIKTKLLGFAIGGAVAGLAGAFYIQHISLVQPRTLGFQWEVQLLFFVIIGGMSTPWGALVGAVAFTVIPETLRFATFDRYWILGLILLAVILIRPQGLLSRRPIESNWRDTLGPWRPRWARPSSEVNVTSPAIGSAGDGDQRSP